MTDVKVAEDGFDPTTCLDIAKQLVSIFDIAKQLVSCWILDIAKKLVSISDWMSSLVLSHNR